MALLLSNSMVHDFPSMNPYHARITPASRLSALVSHLHHNPFLRPQHLYRPLFTVDPYPIAGVQAQVLPLSVVDSVCSLNGLTLPLVVQQ